MAERRSVLSDGAFFGAMSLLMGGAFGLVVGFTYAEIYGAGWNGGLMVGGIIAIIAAILFGRLGAGAELPAPNSVRIDVEPAPTTARSAEAERAAVTPSEPLKMSDVSTAMSDVSTAVKETVRSAVDTVSETTAKATAAISEKTPLAFSGSGSEGATEPAVARDAIKPAGIDGPRDGTPDDLKRIKGVGPKLEELLNSLGYYHLDQIAAWTPVEVDWVDSNLEGFSGRATRDDWVGQARLLSQGGETEFSTRVDRGEVY